MKVQCHHLMVSSIQWSMHDHMFCADLVISQKQLRLCSKTYFLVLPEEINKLLKAVLSQTKTIHSEHRRILFLLKFTVSKWLNCKSPKATEGLCLSTVTKLRMKGKENYFISLSKVILINAQSLASVANINYGSKASLRSWGALTW